MPVSDKTLETPGRSLAIAAQTLYLLNLLLLPGLAFLLLLGLYVSQRKRAPDLARNHLSQTVGVSLLGGALILCVITPALALGGVHSGYTWMIVVLYFTFIHSTLILLGVLGLVKAMAGQHFRFPLVGRWFAA